LEGRYGVFSLEWAMIVPECSGLFIGFLWRKSYLNMPPHPQDGVSMQHVEGKYLCHTASDVGKQPETKKQLQKQAVLWCRKNHHTHIKTNAFFDGANALSAHLFAESVCNQLQPESGADAKTEASALSAGCC